MPSRRKPRASKPRGPFGSRRLGQVPLSGRGIASGSNAVLSAKCEVCFAIPCGRRQSRMPAGFERRLFRQAAQILAARSRPMSVRSCRGVALPGAPNHNLLHHRNKLFLLSPAEAFERLMMRRTRRGLDPAQQALAGFGQPAHLRPPIPAMHGAFDKFAGLQPLERACRGGAIKHHFRRQRRLVGGSTSRERRQKAVLQRRQVEGRALLLKQGDMNLVQPPDQKSRPLLQRPGAAALSRCLTGHTCSALASAAPI